MERRNGFVTAKCLLCEHYEPLSTFRGQCMDCKTFWILHDSATRTSD